MLDHLDHLVLTTANLASCVEFYSQVLGMRLARFGNGRVAFHFGQQKINVHEVGREFEPKSHLPTPGSLDLCFIAAIPLDDFIAHLHQHNIAIIAGPDQRDGAQYAIRSVYIRDPDQNLIEISERWQSA